MNEYAQRAYDGAIRFQKLAAKFEGNTPRMQKLRASLYANARLWYLKYLEWEGK